MSPAARVVKAAEQPAPRITVREVCPCGSTYTSGLTPDPVLYAAWLGRHMEHGFLRREVVP